MTIEEIIQQILAKHPEISREQVFDALANERNKTGGLIADATLLRLMAAKYGVEIPHARVYSRELSTRHLVAGLNDVTVIGRIVAVFPPRTFEGKTSGKYASLMIADKDSVLRVMLWNDKVDPVESGELKVGQVARFSHGYTREDRVGKAELHMGSKSAIQIEPEGVDTEDFPDIGRFATKIKELADTRNGVHLVGNVRAVFSSSTFARSDMSAGTVLRFTVADDTGEVAVVAWNERAEELEKTLEVNASVQLVNARVKAAQNGGYEVHVDSSTFVNVSAVQERLTKIAALSEGLGCVTVEGEVAVAPAVREVATSRGETVKLAVFELKDDTGSVRVSAWRNHVDAVGGLKVGDWVRLKNVYVKKGFGGLVELSTRNASAITVREV